MFTCALKVPLLKEILKSAYNNNNKKNDLGWIRKEGTAVWRFVFHCTIKEKLQIHTCKWNKTLRGYASQVHLKNKTAAISASRVSMEKEKKGERGSLKKKKNTPTHFPIQWSFRKCLWQQKLSNTSSCSDLTFLEGIWKKQKLKSSSLFFYMCKFTFRFVFHSSALQARNSSFDTFLWKQPANFNTKIVK